MREREEVLQGVGMGGPGAVDDDDRLFVAEVLDPEIAALDEQIRRREAYFRTLRAQNAAAKGVPGADPAATEEQADSNRDLADSNRDLADSNRDVNESIDERPKDPLIDEASRVQRDLQRLKLSYEQGELTHEQYVDAIEAHVRRLDGLYGRVTNPDQSRAVLQARGAFLDELTRLERAGAEQLQAIRDVNRGRLEEDAFPRTVTGANLRARQRTRAREEAEAAQEAWEQETLPALQRIAEERARVEEDAFPRTVTGANLRARMEARERARQAERDAARAPLLEDGRRALAEARAAASAVTAEAHSLGLSVSREIKDGTLEGLRELEAALVERLNELGDDPSAAPLMGLLTRTRTGIIELTQAEIDNARASRAYVRQSLANLNLGTTTTSRYVGVLDRARGVVVRLTEAQRELGEATRDDVRAALEEQITSIERILPKITEGSDLYYELVAALREARQALADLNAEVAANIMPDLTDELSVRAAARAAEAEIASIQAQIAAGPDAALLAALEGRLAFLQALLQVLRQAMA
ncbi:MAG TPA: hypothetical protein VF202_09675, partial [Trueperaceae bacterium]